MQFAVRALSPDAVVTELTVEALDPADARRQIEARGMVVADVRAAGGALRRASGGGMTLLLFSQELLALLQAGLGVVEALEALLEKESHPVTRSVLARLLGGLREGKRFSAVLAEQGERFPPLYVGIVRAAEGTSDLPRALARYIDYQQRIDSVRSKLISASIYPAILLLVGGGVSTFLITYVVPRFAEVYEGAGRNLPFLSQLLLSWGRFAANHTRLVLAALAIVAGLAWLGLRRLLAPGGLLRLLGRLPGIGEKVQVYELSRLYLTLGMLSEGGIPIVQAMDTVQGLVSPPLAAGLARARQMVESGLPLSQAFEANGLCTPISLRLLRVGERTGDMGPMLSQSAAFYDGEIARWIERFTRSVEPLLMAAIGLIVGAIVVLLYMPIFDLAGDMT
ncbi:type II secretion system F family protein [Massilia sp. TS11]|uniref:type II secretion system F family protein n=1 Tax=Massilia sp. TS11 TaxID=2908003 RepID=UPI001ED9ECFE|nr:type II secretion system F family protein [Massilia sp. TS11]MCG2586555.1 type II secretion system F family protein [Massilia sp. TS11]